MFSTLRLRQRKGSDKKNKQPDSKPSSKQNKWSLEKAFCPGMGGNSTGAETENTVPRDRQPIHQFSNQQTTFNNNPSSTDTYARSDDQTRSTADYRSNLVNFPSSPISYRENQVQNDYKPISRSGTPPSPRLSHQFQTNYNNGQFQQRTDYNNQYYQRYPQECQQCINENFACQQQQTAHQEHGEEDGMVSRVVGLALERDDTGLGINLMGGRLPDGSCTPLTVTYIKPNSPAHKEGTLRVGDRLLAVNGRSLTGLTLREVELALSVPLVWLTVEYDVSLLTRLRSAGPLVVDVESPTKANVGLSLIDSGGKVIVSNVKPASLAERCGALLPGDQILGVNDVRITAGFTAEETTNMLNNFTGQLLQIEILPVPTISRERMCPSPSWSQGSQRCLYDPGGGSSCSRRSASPGYRSGSPAAFRTGSPYRSNSPACRSSSPVCRSQSPTCHQLSASCHGSLQSNERCHELVVERGVVTLHAPAGQGFGLKFRWVPSKMAAVISDLDTNGVADRSGVLQIGDRITAVNGCRPGVELDAAPSVTLEVEFDVEVHQPAAAGSTIRVQLARSPSSGFGITINGSSDYGSSIVISRVRWGSVAHRSGRLAVGDHLLAIGETRLAGDIHLATSVLKHCPNMISFTILKNPNNVDLGYSSSGLPSVDSTVESWDSSGADGNAKTSEVSSNYSGLGALEGDWTERMTQSLHSIATQQSVEGDSCGLDAGNTGRGRLKGGGKPPPSPPCPLQTNYRLRNNIGPKHWRQSSFVSTTTSDAFADLEALEAELKSVAGIKECGPTFLTFRGETQAKATSPSHPQQSKPNDSLRIKVSLFKDPIYEDFGFSVSDGLYERGVFINRIRPGGPADLSRTLRPFDRIVQVNETKTEDFDCCLTVPLVASSPDPLVLIVERSTSKTPNSINQNSNTTSKNSFSNMEDEDKVQWVEMGVEVKMENSNNYQTL